MRQERFDKAARIPVRVRHGKIEFLYDVEFPTLAEGAIGELVVDADAIQDPDWKHFLVGETAVEIAPAGSVIAFGVALDKGALAHEELLISFQQDLNLTHATISDPRDADGLAVFGDGCGVLGHLTAPLFLRLRGQNLSQISGGAPSIPALEALKQRADFPTLNQAAIAVSQTFEPERQGHSGDIFRDVYLLRENDWLVLNIIRDGHEAQHEEARWQEIGLDPLKVRQRIANRRLLREKINEFASTFARHLHRRGDLLQRTQRRRISQNRLCAVR